MSIIPENVGNNGELANSLLMSIQQNKESIRNKSLKDNKDIFHEKTSEPNNYYQRSVLSDPDRVNFEVLSSPEEAVKSDGDRFENNDSQKNTGNIGNSVYNPTKAAKTKQL